MLSEISKTRKVCMCTHTHTHICKYLEVLSQNNKSDFSFLWFREIMDDFNFLYIFFMMSIFSGWNIIIFITITKVYCKE